MYDDLLSSVRPALAHHSRDDDRGRDVTRARQVFRQTVSVEKPSGVTGRAAELVIDARAQRALTEAFIATRLSPVVLELRGASS